MNIEQFFKINQDILEQNYPGLNFTIFERFITENSLDVLMLEEELLSGIPFGYITGKSYFYKNEFIVNSNTLIPRNETEILIEEAIDFLKNHQSPKSIIDVGTGSGCIIISIADEMKRNLNYCAVDISSKAIEIAKRNELSILKSQKIEWILGDRFSNIHQKFDLIVSNPPYIPHDESGVHQSVKLYEPEVALFITRTEYEVWFSHLFTQVHEHLARGGMFIMEGHENYLKSQLKLAEKCGLKNCSIKQDYTGRDRFLISKNV